jgi:hypothetical protein
VQSLVPISDHQRSINWRLTESVHIEHVLPVGDEIVQCIIWSKSDIVAAVFIVIVLFTAIVSDCVILIVFSRQEMLREIVPLRVEKDLVEDHIGQDDD